MNVRERFRELLTTPGLKFMPGAYDSLSARIIEHCGFPAVCAGGYAGVGSMLAEPDGGQSNMRDYADHYGRICDAIDVPVFADADTGFGGVHNVRRMVRAFERAGVAALFLSDQVFPNRCGYLPGKAIVPMAEALARLNAALDARTDPDLVIGMRTDAKALEGVDAAIERCRMFAEAGADMVLPQGCDAWDDAKLTREALPTHYTYNMSHAAGKAKLTLAQVEDLGYTMATFPSAALFAAVGGVKRAMEALKRDRSFAAVEKEIIALDDYYDIVRLKRHNEQEQGWVEKAEAMAKAKKAKAAE